MIVDLVLSPQRAAAKGVSLTVFSRICIASPIMSKPLVIVSHMHPLFTC